MTQATPIQTTTTAWDTKVPPHNASANAERGPVS